MLARIHRRKASATPVPRKDQRDSLEYKQPSPLCTDGRGWVGARGQNSHSVNSKQSICLFISFSEDSFAGRHELDLSAGLVGEAESAEQQHSRRLPSPSCARSPSSSTQRCERGEELRRALLAVGDTQVACIFARSAHSRRRRRQLRMLQMRMPPLSSGRGASSLMAQAAASFGSS